MDFQLAGADTPADSKEARTGLSHRRGDGDADDGLVAGYGEHADVLAVVVVLMGGVVVAGVAVEARVYADMAAGEGYTRLVADFHPAGVLRPDFGSPLDGVVTGLEGVEVDGLPAHGLIDGLVLVPASCGVLDCRERVAGAGLAGIAVVALRDESRAHGRCGLELPGSNLVHAHARLGHTEERCDILAEAIGHLHAHRVDASRCHGELQRTGLGVVLPHAHIRRVLDAVDRNAVDGATVHGLAGFAVVGDDDLGGRGGRGDRDLALAVLLTLEHGDAVGEVPLIRGDVHRDIGADLDGQRHVLGAVEGELAVLGLGERDGRKLRLGCVCRDGRERVEHGAGDEHG